MHAAALVLLLAPVSYTLVFSDRTGVVVAGPPRVQGELAVAELADGTQVSFPNRKIDWARTEARARQEADAELAAAAAAEQADRARLEREAARRNPVPRRSSSAVIDNQVLQAFGVHHPAAAVPPPTGTSSMTELTREAPSDLEPQAPKADRDGRGPGYWQDRAREVRDHIRLAERELQAARTALATEEDALVRGRVVTSADGAISVRHLGGTSESLGALQYRISELRERVGYAAEALDDARQHEADLREEARIAGADPGWIRLTVAYR